MQEKKKQYILDDLLRIKALHLRICVELVEIRYTQCQICICKKLDRLCFRIPHDQRVNILLDCAFLQQPRICMCRRNQSLIIHIRSNNDAAWV